MSVENVKASQSPGQAKQNDALRIAKEYYNVRNFIRGNFREFGLKNPLDDSQKGSGKMEIPARLVNGGEGNATLEIKDGKYVVTKVNPDGKRAWQVTYKKDQTYQGVAGNLRGDNSITKNFVDSKGKAKTVGITTNFEATEAKTQEVKYPGRKILEKAKDEVFAKEKEQGPVTEYKHGMIAPRVASDLEEILKFTKENPQIQRMKDPYGGDGTVSVKLDGNRLIVAKEGKNHAWQDIYDLSLYNKGGLNGTIIKQHISSDPSKSRAVTVQQDAAKYGHGAELKGIVDMPEVYFKKDQNTGKFVKVDERPEFTPTMPDINYYRM